MPNKSVEAIRQFEIGYSGEVAARAPPGTAIDTIYDDVDNGVIPSALVSLVEDDELMRSLLQTELEAQGYEVAVASTGEDAMALLGIRGAEFGALITDVELTPGKLNGWDVARNARRAFSDLPVIYITGTRSAEWFFNGVPRSVLLAKPFATAQFVTALSQLLHASARGTEGAYHERTLR
jgi:DNA-binding response OmpR family regulator